MRVIFADVVSFMLFNIYLNVTMFYLLSTINNQLALLHYTSQDFCFLHLKGCRRRKSNWHQLFCVFSVFCFPGILTMSTPWMTGARPSVECKCRSYNSWSCRYCLSVCFGPNIYVSSSPDTSSVSAEPLPVRLISATGSLIEGGGVKQNEIILYICK